MAALCRGSGEFLYRSFRRFQEEQGVASRRRIDDDDLVLPLVDDIGKGMEDGNFLRTWRAQIFFDIG